MQRWAWVGLGALVWAGCGAGAGGEDNVESVVPDFYADSTPPTRDQVGELRALGQVDDASFRPVTHDVQLLRGPMLALAGDDPSATAKAFVAAHPAIFQGAAVKVEAPESVGDEKLVRASQIAEGRRVEGGDLVFNFDAQGRLKQVAGAARQVGALPAAKLDVQDAAEAAVRWLKDAVPGAQPVVLGPAEAVVHEGKGAYRVELEASPESGPTRRAVLVDDQSGKILGDEEELLSVKGSGVGVFGERRELQVSQLDDGRWALMDPTRGGGIVTYAWEGGALPGKIVSSADPTHWDATGSAPGSAVDAHANAAIVFDYYAQVFHRSGLDGKSGPLVSTVHYGQRFDNAFWDGAQMVYGDGDGRTFAPLAGGLDVVAHELTHGVTQYTGRLGHKGQAGALNEAVSDAFASFVQRRSGDPKLAWQIGATIYTPGKSGDALRDLSDPQRLGQPDHMSLYRDDPQDAQHDNGGVHWNSTIPGHAFFLMSEGGTNRTSGRRVTGIGATKAEQVLFHALTHGVTPSTDFAQMARACVASAQTLEGASAANAVRAAWEAVGVLVPEGDGSPPQDKGSGDVEPNNTRKKASSLAAGEAVTGEIGDAKDLDYYRFTLAAGRDLNVALTGFDQDLDLRLYDSRGHLVAKSEQPGNQAEGIRGRAKAGTYYLKVFAAPESHPSHARYRLELR